MLRVRTFGASFIVVVVVVVARVADTTKQALGMLEIHFVNLTLSVIFKEKECIS